MLRETYHRRSFLGLAAAAATLVACPSILRARGTERSLSLHNLHTGESLEAVYWADGRYVEDGLAEIDRVLRDHRADEVGRMDPQLLDMLHGLKARIGADAPFHIISGYRSPATNAMLRKKGGGVAKRSLHMRGMAVDIRVPGYDTGRLREAALSMKAGGVGYYRKSDFIHVDTGRVRFW